MQFGRPLWLMNSWPGRGVPRFLYMFAFWTKAECSNWLKSWFWQPLIGRFKHTNRSTHAPTPRVTASQTAKFSSYILLLLPKIWFLLSLLMSFLLPFPVQSVTASLLFSLSKTLYAAYGSVYLITLIKYLYINLHNLTILLTDVSSFLQNRHNPVQTVMLPQTKSMIITFSIV
jgi:hypothetical protein